jgi:AcrR family transcriptional regulator
MPAQRRRGRAAAIEALVASAQRLIAERGPAGVTLREVADDAGVNFGLVYQYIGTKEQLLAEVYARAATGAAEQLRDAKHLDDAIDLLMQRGDGTVARLLAWAALEQRAASATGDLFGSSPALAALASLAERDAATSGTEMPHEQAQVLAALTMAIAVGWRLFGPIAVSAADLDPAEIGRYTETVRSLLRRFAADLTVDGDAAAPG